MLLLTDHLRSFHSRGNIQDGDVIKCNGHTSMSSRMTTTPLTMTTRAPKSRFRLYSCRGGRMMRSINACHVSAICPKKLIFCKGYARRILTHKHQQTAACPLPPPRLIRLGMGTLAEPLERRIAGVLMSALHYRERRSQASSTDLSSLSLSISISI